MAEQEVLGGPFGAPLKGGPTPPASAGGGKAEEHPLRSKHPPPARLAWGGRTRGSRSLGDPDRLDKQMIEERVVAPQSPPAQKATGPGKEGPSLNSGEK